MSDEQAERILRELRAIKHALWTGLLCAALIFTTTRAIGAVLGPPPPPTISLQPPR